MSTHCYIGQLQSDGSVRSVYCHYDGYPDGVGKILLHHYGLYNIRTLLDRGNISSLEPSIEATEFYDESVALQWANIAEFAQNGQEYNYLLLTTDRWCVHNAREYPRWLDLQLAINEGLDDE